ncbi:VWA domain-containing protein [Crenobacter cavernae]|uniref:VWA domain-containing protein n=1 Tax=Crenobacter cavernae TaxID=2290923 RepID=A0ABY0FE22_9NEIS|nr:VWA domain-containing protein [Crenobacter cavernae]RXZ44486.1 VWA domain-containing protein [Crenobacter cavernae]
MNAYPVHADAAVPLSAMETLLPVLFRALGGDPALKLKPAGPHGAHAWQDEATLYLPESIALFADADLNRQLYVWLAALSAEPVDSHLDWLNRNRAATAACLARQPGLASEYRALVAAFLPLRPDPATLTGEERLAELAVRAALLDPEREQPASANLSGLAPVPLWLHPSPPRREAKPEAGANKQQGSAAPAEAPADGPRAKKTDKQAGEQKKAALTDFKFEAKPRWEDYLNDHRDNQGGGEGGSGEEEKGPRATGAIDGDDAPPATSGMTYGFAWHTENDDTPLGPGIKLPEWDCRKNVLLPDYCLLKPMLPAGASRQPLPDNLRSLARYIQRQFQALTPERSRKNGEFNGPDIDLDRVIRFFVERHSGHAIGEPGLYQAWPQRERSLACLLLADLSLSTENRLPSGHKIIDVIRDSLVLFAEALTASGDRFGLYGFSSIQREEVRFLVLKDFAERYDDETRGRVLALRPGYYTRMGAAIRQSSSVLSEQPAERRLLLIVSDGKPSDLDHYDGRYAVEDTREAVREARSAGVTPFCVTVDQEASAYLPHIFGSNGFVVVQQADTLPHVLTRLYAQMTR